MEVKNYNWSKDIANKILLLEHVKNSTVEVVKVLDIFLYERSVECAR